MIVGALAAVPFSRLMGANVSQNQPYFRFYPGAYGPRGSLEPSDDVCEVCRKACVWKYTGVVYSTKDVEVVCARCIADGRLAASLEKDMQLHDITLNGAARSMEEELLTRTPGVSSWNPFDWPVLDRTPLAFIGYGEDAEIEADPKAVAAIRSARERDFGNDNDVGYPLVFRELNGRRYRAVIDLD